MDFVGFLVTTEVVDGVTIATFEKGAPNVLLDDGRPGYYVSVGVLHDDPSLEGWLRHTYGLVRDHLDTIGVRWVFAPPVARGLRRS